MVNHGNISIGALLRAFSCATVVTLVDLSIYSIQKFQLTSRLIVQPRARLKGVCVCNGI